MSRLDYQVPIGGLGHCNNRDNRDDNNDDAYDDDAGNDDAGDDDAGDDDDGDDNNEDGCGNLHSLCGRQLWGGNARNHHSVGSGLSTCI